MSGTTIKLIEEIRVFLDETGMGKTYFGKKSIGNSELVHRLENGGRVWPDTERRIRDFMSNYRLTNMKRNAA